MGGDSISGDGGSPGEFGDGGGDGSGHGDQRRLRRPSAGSVSSLVIQQWRRPFGRPVPVDAPGGQTE